MKKTIFIIALSVAFSITTLSTFSQAIKFGTKQIGQWRLEHFPLNYYKPAFKTIIQKFPIVNKIALYQQVNQSGQNDGLRVEMQTDFVSPHTIYYYKNGVTVYSAYYFANSPKAYEIDNKNLNDQYNGPQIKREIVGGKIIEKTTTFKNGEDLANRGAYGSDILNFDLNGLLNGIFRWTAKLPHLNGTLQYSGIANEGIIKKLIVKSSLGESYEQFTCTYIAKGDTLTQNKVTTSGDNSYNTYPISTLFKITNSKEIANKDVKSIFYQDIYSYNYEYLQPNYFERVIVKMLNE